MHPLYSSDLPRPSACKYYIADHSARHGSTRLDQIHHMVDRRLICLLASYSFFYDDSVSWFYGKSKGYVWTKTHERIELIYSPMLKSGWLRRELYGREASFYFNGGFRISSCYKIIENVILGAWDEVKASVLGGSIYHHRHFILLSSFHHLIAYIIKCAWTTLTNSFGLIGGPSSLE